FTHVPRPGISPLSLHDALPISAFFGTTLASLLASAGCDTVVVTGASTSGCVRATALDAMQHGYRVVVPREAVGDRNPAAHEANLDRKSTRLNSSHVAISYAVFC